MVVVEGSRVVEVEGGSRVARAVKEVQWKKWCSAGRQLLTHSQYACVSSPMGSLTKEARRPEGKGKAHCCRL